MYIWIFVSLNNNNLTHVTLVLVSLTQLVGDVVSKVSIYVIVSTGTGAIF